MGAFPSLRITATDLVPEGAFAEAQAAYLRPDTATVKRLATVLREKKIGVVAHFYMDPELQGVLANVHAGGPDHEAWPWIHVSDSLVMADKAVEMAEGGCRAVVVLGVDFMSENARAMLDAGGFPNVPVYRVAIEPIGCSLAESAEARAYGAFLTEASRTKRPLHVVYINTSLVTKAKAHALVPTITCTSSNVVRTVLQAAAQIPDVNVYFGPDTYMGQNLQHLFEALASMDCTTCSARRSWRPRGASTRTRSWLRTSRCRARCSTSASRSSSAAAAWWAARRTSCASSPRRCAKPPKPRIPRRPRTITRAATRRCASCSAPRPA
ncbi:MAG: quinolinate synthase NadA [Myxococcota bacterium]|nr:quinolinate synthase NadA [Myxococcota bacterium]